MVSYDRKVFWRYIYQEHLHPRNWAKNSAFYEYIMMFTILYAVIFSNLSLNRKAILFMGFLIGISIIKFYSLYKSGYHRHWNRKTYGIPSKSDIKRLKEKTKLNQKVVDIPIEKKGENLPVKKEEFGISKEESANPL